MLAKRRQASPGIRWRQRPHLWRQWQKALGTWGGRNESFLYPACEAGNRTRTRPIIRTRPSITINAVTMAANLNRFTIFAFACRRRCMRRERDDEKDPNRGLAALLIVLGTTEATSLVELTPSQNVPYMKLSQSGYNPLRSQRGFLESPIKMGW
jgi:hypothetical protein